MVINSPSGTSGAVEFQVKGALIPADTLVDEQGRG